MSTEAVARFWDSYIEKLNKNNIIEKRQRWYVYSIERLIKFSNGAKISSHKVSFIRYYFTELGRDTSVLTHNHFQHVDALKILYCDLIQSGWAQEFEWSYWLQLSKKQRKT